MNVYCILYSTPYGRYLNIRDCSMLCLHEQTEGNHQVQAPYACTQFMMVDDPKTCLGSSFVTNPWGNSFSRHISGTVRTLPGLAAGHKKKVKVSTTLLLCEDQYTTLSSWAQGDCGLLSPASRDLGNLPASVRCRQAFSNRTHSTTGTAFRPHIAPAVSTPWTT